jgi:Pyruvate/2-oxoacid:ferredoxin oxidoreductase delta subunit
MDAYEKLRTVLDAHPTGAPPSPAIDRILRILFTPEEAALSAVMSFAPRPVPAIAAKAGLDPADAERMLEAMADRAVVFCREKDGKRSYGLLPTIPGLFEFPFMKGRTRPEHEELAKLWDEYHREGLGASFSGNPTPVARVIPVGESLEPAGRVHPYEEVAKLIGESEFIGLGRCACRIAAGACNSPTETCLFFDAPARFLVQRGYAREVGRVEALRVLGDAEKAGLVHVSNNSADRPTFLCNCCRCCCTILTCKTQLSLPNAFSTSGFLARVDAEACTGCGICADERCPVGAATMVEDVAVVAVEACIGCGLCVTGCPAEAIALVRRENPPAVCADMQEMGARILQEKGKLQRFMEVMKG